MVGPLKDKSWYLFFLEERPPIIPFVYKVSLVFMTNRDVLNLNLYTLNLITVDFSKNLVHIYPLRFSKNVYLLSTSTIYRI